MAVPVSHEQRQESEIKALGFWIYLMTDCVLFAGLFATYIILRNNTFGGVSGKDIFNMPSVLFETLLLLTSSFTCGLALIAARRAHKRQTILLLGTTIVLGMGFLATELTEFTHLAMDGHTWQASAFLSAFFTLVGTHGLHITIGLLWALVLVWQMIRRGITAGTLRRLNLFALFWHFLDIIWIFIFTIVYLMGVA